MQVIYLQDIPFNASCVGKKFTNYELHVQNLIKLTFWGGGDIYICMSPGLNRLYLSEVTSS